MSKRPILIILKLTLFLGGCSVQLLFWMADYQFRPPLRIDNLTFILSFFLLAGSVVDFQFLLEYLRANYKKIILAITRVVIVLSLAANALFAYYLTYPNEGATLREPAPFLMFGSGKNIQPQNFGYKEINDFFVYQSSDELRELSDRTTWLFQTKYADSLLTSDETFDIFLVGPSTVYNTPLGGFIENQLGNLSPRANVVNVSSLSYNSSQFRVAMDLAVFPKKPDMVVWYMGFLDAYIPIVYGVRPGDHFLQGIDYGIYYDPSMRFKLWLTQRIPIYKDYMIGLQAEAIAEHNRAIIDNAQERKRLSTSIASIYLNNLEYVQKRCKQEDIPCIFTFDAFRLIPIIADPKNDETKLTPEEQLLLDAYNEIIRQSQQEKYRDLKLVFMTWKFDQPGDEKYFEDTVHFCPDGYKLLANEIAKLILQNINNRK